MKLESNLDRVLEQLARIESEVASFLVTMTTDAGPKRDASKNYKVLAIQKNVFKRDPWFLSAAEERACMARFNRAVADGGSVEQMRRAADDVGRIIVDAYRQHITARKNARGAMPDVSEQTAKRKQKKGRAGNPPLVDTGELVDSLTWKTERIR